MKPKTAVILILFAVLLGAASLMLRRQSSQSWQQQPASSSGKLLDFPINDVASITIQAAGQQVHITETDGQWSVRERQYPADFSRLSDLLKTLWQLKSVQDIPAGPSQWARFNLIMPGSTGTTSGTLIDLRNAQDQRLAALLAGKNLAPSDEPNPAAPPRQGRYVMPLTSGSSVALISETLNGASTRPDYWIDHTFFKVDRIKSIALSGTNPGFNWKLNRLGETSEWQLADVQKGERLDSARMPAFAEALGEPTLIDVLPPGVTPASRGFDHPITVVAESFDGLTYTMQIGALKDNDYPIMVTVTADLPKERNRTPGEKPDETKRLDGEFAARQKMLRKKIDDAKQYEGRICLVGKFSIDGLVKERSSILAPAPSPSPSPGVGGKPQSAADLVPASLKAIPGLHFGVVQQSPTPAPKSKHRKPAVATPAVSAPPAPHP